MVDVTAEQFGHHWPRVAPERDPGLYRLLCQLTPFGEEHCRRVLEARDEDYWGVMVTTGLKPLFSALMEQEYRAKLADGA